MSTIQLRGRITPQGKLDVKLPAGLMPGEVRVTVEMTEDTSKSEFPTGAEIIEWLQRVGGWEDDGSDGAKWVERIREEERKRRGW